MYAFAPREKASEKPQKNHWKDTTAVAMTDSHINERADLRRARPE